MGLGNFDDWEAEEANRNTGIFGDSIDMLQSGAIDTAAGVAKFVGAENLSDSLDDWSQDQYKTLSDEGKAAMSKRLINDDLSIGEGAKDPRTWWLNSMNVLGGMAATMLPAGAVGKAASLAGNATKVGANAGKITVGVNALLNGAAGNGSAARGVSEDINNLSFDDLKDSPRFKDLAQTYMAGGSSPVEAMTQAREEMATSAGDELSKDFSLFALNSVLDTVGDRGFAKLVGGSLGKTVKGALAKGVATEGGTEAAQGYGETVLSNIAREDQTNEGRDITEGAAANALEGGLLGAVIGGGPAPVSAQVGKFRRRNFESKIEEVVNPEIITKMQAQGITEPEIKRVLGEGVSNQAINLGFDADEAKQLSDQAINFAFGNMPSAQERHAVQDEAEANQTNEHSQQQNQAQPQDSAPLTWSEENGYPDPSEFGLSEQDAELIIDPPAELLRGDGTIDPKAPKELKQAYQLAMGRAEANEYQNAVFGASAQQREQSQIKWDKEAQQNLNWQQAQDPKTIKQDQTALAESIRAGDLAFVDNTARSDQNFADGLRVAMDISPSAVLQIAQLRRNGEMNENQAISALQRVINSVNNFDDQLTATPEELELRTQANRERAQQDLENMPNEQRRQEIQARLLQGRQQEQQTNSTQAEQSANGERDVSPYATGIENRHVPDAPQVEFDRWSDVVAGDQDIDQRNFDSPLGNYPETKELEQDTIHQPRERGEMLDQQEEGPTDQELIDQFRGQRAGVINQNLEGVNPKSNERLKKKQRSQAEEGKRAIAARIQEQQEANQPQDYSTMYTPNSAMAEALQLAKESEPKQKSEEPQPEQPKKKATQVKVGDGVNGEVVKEGKVWKFTRPGTDVSVDVSVNSEKGFVEVKYANDKKRFYYGKKGEGNGIELRDENSPIVDSNIAAGSFNKAKELSNKYVNQQLDSITQAIEKHAQLVKETKEEIKKEAKLGLVDRLKAEREVIAKAVKAFDAMALRDAMEDKDPTSEQKRDIEAGIETFGIASKAYTGISGLFRAGKPLKEKLANYDSEIEKLDANQTPKKRKNYSWDAVKLAENYTAEELDNWVREIQNDPEYQNKDGGIHLLNAKGRKIIDALTWAVTYHHQEQSKAKQNNNDDEPEPPKPPKKRAPKKKVDTKAEGTKAPLGLSDFSGGVKAVNAALKGEYSFDEYKKTLQALVDGEKAIREEIAQSPVVKRKRKQEVKDSLIRENFNRLVYGMAQAISPNYGSYEGFDVFDRRPAIEQLKERVDKLTKSQYDENIEKRQQQKAKSEADEKARQEGLKNPETRADFMRLANEKGIGLNSIAKILDDKQLAAFDKLAVKAISEKQESEFQREIERRGNIQAVEGTDSVGHETELSTFDDGSPSYVVRLTDRIGKEKWKELAQAARRIDRGVKVANARYAKQAGKPEGWHFTSQEASNQFVQLLGGEAVNATENVQAQAEEKATTAREKQVSKLNSLAESQENQANDVLNQTRKTNTAKRASDAARVMDRAYNQQENARTLSAIAKAVESGEITMLGNLQDLTQLEELDGLKRRLLWNMSDADREKFAERDNMGRWHLKETTTIDEIVRFAKFPDPEMHVSNLRSLARDMATVKGYLNTGKFIAKQVDNHGEDNLITMTGPVWDKHIAKIRAFSKIQKYGLADRANELFKTEGRLNRMGIVDNATLREALRELDSVKKGVTTSKPKETPVTRLTKVIEEKVRGNRKAYIDFFPTDNDKLANDVIDKADIKEGMKVLEPSAGMGDLADRIAGKGADLDVGDISSDMRELLDAKGHNVVSDDFLSMESEPIYDRVVMNPPFNKDSAIDHINHALTMLKPGGRLVAITPINTGDKGNSKNKNFREYLDAVSAVEEANESGSFKNSLNSTGVETKTIVIDKPENAADLPPPEDIRFSQASVTNVPAKSIDPKVAQRHADNFIAEYEGLKGVNVTVVKTQEELSSYAVTKPKSTVKGVWLSGDNRVVLVAENIANAQDLRRVLRHELIAHNGLYANLSAQEIKSLTSKVNALRSNGKLKAIFAEVDKSYKGAPDDIKAEEVIARLAESEQGSIRKIADRVISFVMGALRRSGMLAKDSVSISEVRTMINNADKFLRTKKGKLRSPDVVRFSQTVTAEDMKELDLGDPVMSYADAVNSEADSFYKTMLGKIPSKLKSTSLYDAMKGNGWGLLTLRQIAEVAKSKVSTNYSNLLDQYVTTVNHKMARQNALLEDVTDLSEDVRLWIKKGNKEKADELFNFMHEATISNVDPSREYQDLTDLLTDMIAIKEEQIRGRSGQSNKQLFEELKQYKQDLKGEHYRRKAHAKMKRVYDKMTDEQKEFFNRVRDHYEKQQDDMFNALVDRAAKLSLSGTGAASSKQALNVHNRLIKEFGKTHAAELGKLGSSEIALELAIAKKGYYVPLARFGKYWVSTKWESGKKPNGDIVLDSQFEMFESEEEMNTRVKQLQAAGYKPKFGKNIEESGMVSGATMSFVTDFMDKINSANAQNEVKEQLKDDLYQMFLQTLPDRSIRKSFIHRKGTRGYSDNALRALADQGFKQSRQQARLETEDDLQAILTGVNDMAKAETNNVSAQRIADEMNKRHEWVMNPKRAKWAQKLTGIGFFMLIGASPASALMNLTQNVQVAIPVIGSKYGYAATAAEMGRLTKLWITNRYAASKDHKTKNKFGVIGSILEGEEREAMRRAVEQGTIDVTQTSDALGLAEEPDTHVGDWKDRVNRALGWSFHNAEVLNREVTFMTAYRLARKGGMDGEAAYHYATKATWDSHFDYGSLNRARFMQGDVATVALQFKQYSQNMSYYLISNTLKALGKGNPTPEQKAIARKQIMGTMALTFALGGLSAMPVATLAGIANMIHAAIGDDDDPWDAETELRGILSEWFGEEWARTLYNGLPPEVGLPAVGGRINIDFLRMWVRESDAENASGTIADIGEQFFGPIGGIITGAARGVDYAMQGRTHRAAEQFLPKWIKDISKTARYISEGGNVTNRNGEVMVADLTPIEYFGQLVGFTPTRLSEQYDINSRVKKYEGKVMQRRKLLMNQMWVSYLKKDKDEIKNIWKHIKNYNKSEWGRLNPITSEAVSRSIKQHLKMQTKAVNGLHYNPKFESMVRNSFIQK